MSTRNAAIAVAPVDESIVVTITTYSSATSDSPSTADFSEPILQINNLASGTYIIQKITLTDGVLANNHIETIDNLTNGDTYAISYFQKGLGTTTAGLIASTDEDDDTIPRGAPAAPSISRGEGGETDGDDFNGFYLYINLNEYDYAPVDKVVIFYTREDSARVTKHILVSDADKVNEIRANGKYTFGDGELVDGATYNFQVRTMDGTLESPPSNPLDDIKMETTPTAVHSISLSIDSAKAGQAKWELMLLAASKTNEDYVKIYGEYLEVDNSKMNTTHYGTERFEIKTVQAKDLTDTKVVTTGTGDDAVSVTYDVSTGVVNVKPGQMVRVIAVPYTKKDIKGEEKISDEVIGREVQYHLLEMSADLSHSNTTAIDGKGDLKINFRASHTDNEVGFGKGRYIDLSKLSIYSSGGTTQSHTFTQQDKVYLDANGEASAIITLAKETGTTVEEKIYLSLDKDGGYKGEYSSHQIQVMASNGVTLTSPDLLSSNASSGDFVLKYNIIKPPKFELSLSKTENSITATWNAPSSMTASKNPTKYTIGLVKNAGVDYQIGTTKTVETLTIENGDEHYTFKDLSRLDENNILNQYSVYVIAQNSAGSSDPARSAAENLPENSLPYNYFEKIVLTPKNMTSGSTENRDVEVRININGGAWLTDMKQLTLKWIDEFGASIVGETDTVVTLTNLTKVTDKKEYTYIMSLEGKKKYYVKAIVTTKARDADDDAGLIEIAEKTSVERYASINLSLPPQIKSSKVSINKSEQESLYSIIIDDGGSDITSVKLIAIPEGSQDMAIIANPAAAPATIVHDVPKKHNTNGNEALYKVVVNYLVHTELSTSGKTLASDWILASNAIGTDGFGKLQGGTTETNFTELYSKT